MTKPNKITGTFSSKTNIDTLRVYTPYEIYLLDALQWAFDNLPDDLDLDSQQAKNGIEGILKRARGIK